MRRHSVSFFFLFLLSLCSNASWSTLQFSGSKVFVFVPQNLEPSSPLMINLHGCAQKAQILVDHGNWEEAASFYKTIVAIPEVPRGGVIAGCWDYYGLNHTRTNRHNGFVIDLVSELKNRFSINNEKVFVSGLSSGGGESFVLGCLAPDIFKGVGLNAAPSVGTSSSEISRATISINQVSKNCQGLAGDRSELLKEQRVSIIYGDNDYLVDRKYSSINAQAYAELLGASVEKPFDTETLRGSNTRGRGTLFSSRASAEPLVSLIENAGLGHNWPAGQGGRGRSFVSKESIDYPYYLLSFFLSNSQR